MSNHLFIAVDLGAGSGRVFLVGFGPEFLFEELHRFKYPPRELAGHLRWDFRLIVDEIKSGLKKARGRAEELGRRIYSLGVDSWAVDYGLIDSNGQLLCDPICYRDGRTNDAMDRVFERVPRSAIFEKTGIQFLNFNTIYQLFSEGSEIEAADKVLLVPDLINFVLTGKAVAEYTNATTTQLVNARSREWESGLLDALDLPSGLFPEIVSPGANLGPLKQEIAEEIGLSNVCVVAPATHDTASAVVGASLEEGWAYISSGTWSLIGIERDDVLINEDVASHNFTNEGGAFDTIRFLKNVMGLWIFELCRREWEENGISTDYADLISSVSAMTNFPGFIFPEDVEFLNPSSMLDAIAHQMRFTGQQTSDDPMVISKVIFDSLAFRYASVLRSIEILTGCKLNGVQIVGGGGKNEYLNQMTADASGLKTQAGVIEAAALGNAAVQAIAAGRFGSLAESREYTKKHVPLKEFSPRRTEEIEEAAERYALVESRFIG